MNSIHGTDASRNGESSKPDFDQAKRHIDCLHRPFRPFGLKTALFALPHRQTEVFDNSDAAASRAIELANDEDVYVRLCPVRKCPPRGRRGDAKFSPGLAVFAIDIDIEDEPHKSSKPRAPSREAALGFLDALPLPPSNRLPGREPSPEELFQGFGTAVSGDPQQEKCLFW